VAAAIVDIPAQPLLVQARQAAISYHMHQGLMGQEAALSVLRTLTLQLLALDIKLSGPHRPLNLPRYATVLNRP